MATVKEIKEELQFNTELKDLLEALRDIAVLQFRTLQKGKERFTVFSQRLKEFFQMVDSNKISHYFINPPTDRLGIVMVTSDEGFMGGLNLEIVESGFAQPGANEAKFIVIGERGERHMKELGKECTPFKGPGAGGRYSVALRLKDRIIEGVKKGEFGRVIVLYPRCLSFMVQKIEIEKILPVSNMSTYQSGRVSRFNLTGPPIIVESPMEGIIEYLVEELVLERLLEILEESKLSEFAARAIHLEKSSQGLDEKEKEIRLRYFRAYHGIIDKGTREVFSSRLIRGVRS